MGHLISQQRTIIHADLGSWPTLAGHFLQLRQASSSQSPGEGFENPLDQGIQMLDDQTPTEALEDASRWFGAENTHCWKHQNKVISSKRWWVISRSTIEDHWCLEAAHSSGFASGLDDLSIRKFPSVHLCCRSSYPSSASSTGLKVNCCLYVTMTNYSLHWPVPASVCSYDPIFQVIWNRSFKAV